MKSVAIITVLVFLMASCQKEIIRPNSPDTSTENDAPYLKSGDAEGTFGGDVDPNAPTGGEITDPGTPSRPKPKGGK